MSDTLLSKREFLREEHSLAAYRTHVSCDDGRIAYVIELRDEDDEAFSMSMWATGDEGLHEGLGRLHKIRAALDETIDAVNTSYLKIGGFDDKNTDS